MWLAGLPQHSLQAIATELVMSNRQEVTEPQPAAVADQNPCRQQQSVRAADRTPRHLRGYRKQVTQLLMAPRPNEGWVALDSADRACTLVHQQAVAEGGLTQGGEHPAVILDGGGSQMFERVREVAVDPVDCQVAGKPGQAFGQDDQLLAVAGRGSARSSVLRREVQESHGGVRQGASPEGATYPAYADRQPPRKFGTIASWAPLAQLSRRCAAGLQPILRAAILGAVATACLAYAFGTAITLVLLGQFGRARVEFRRGFSRRG